MSDLSPGWLRRRLIVATAAATFTAWAGARPKATPSADGPLSEPLLATVYTGQVDPSLCLVSEKYDGVRALWDGRVLRHRSGRPVPAPGLPAYAFDDTGYGRSVYLRTALVLETTRRSYGAARFDRALGHYARAQRFRHPTPDDLFASFDGVFGGGFSDRVLRPALMRGETADARLVRLSSVRNSAGAYLTEIEAQREGTLALPLWIELRGEHGERRRLPWAPGVPRYRASFTARTQFTAALLDPDRHNLLDANALDGTIAHRTAPSRAVLSRVVALFHAMIAAVGA